MTTHSPVSKVRQRLAHLDMAARVFVRRLRSFRARHPGSAQLNKDVKGKSYPPSVLVVSAAAISRSAAAVGNTDPIHHDGEAARAAGFRSVVAPVGGLAMGRTEGASKGEGTIMTVGPLADLRPDFTKTLFGGTDTEYLDIVCAGDRLTGTTRIIDVYERTSSKGGTLAFATIETRYQNEANRDVLISRLTFLERGSA